jgi:hypothetical protein
VDLLSTAVFLFRLSIVNSIKPDKLREQIFEEIQRAIMVKRLKPGDHSHHDNLAALRWRNQPQAVAANQRTNATMAEQGQQCYLLELEQHRHGWDAARIRPHRLHLPG